MKWFRITRKVFKHEKELVYFQVHYIRANRIPTEIECCERLRYNILYKNRTDEILIHEVTEPPTWELWMMCPKCCHSMIPSEGCSNPKCDEGWMT